MANYSLILKLIADDSQFKSGFDKANKALDRHTENVKKAGNSYVGMQQSLTKLNMVAKNAALTFGTQSQEFKDATTAAKAYQKQIEQVDKAMTKQGLGKKADNGILDSITGVALKRIVPLMILNQIGKAFMSTSKTIMEFNVQMSTLQAISGESTKSMKEFASAAISVASNTPKTTREVADLQIEMSKLGLTKVQILQATEAVVNMSIAGMVPLARAAEIAAANMKAFGLQATDMMRVADVMAKSFNISALDIEKFATGISDVAPIARSAGFGIEFTTAALGVLADRGIDASTAGTSLRNIFLKLATDGKDFNSVMKEIATSTNQLGTAQKYFEARTAAVAVTLANSRGELDKFTKSLYDASGASEEAANIMTDNLTGSLERLGGAWEAMTIRIAQSQEGMGKFLRGLSDGAVQAVGILDRVFAGAYGRGRMDGEARLTSLEKVFKQSAKIFEDMGLAEMQVVNDAVTANTKTREEGEKENAAIRAKYRKQAKEDEINQVETLIDETAYALELFLKGRPELFDKKDIQEAQRLQTILDGLKARLENLNTVEPENLIKAILDPDGSGSDSGEKKVRALTGVIEILQFKIKTLNTEMEQLAAISGSKATEGIEAIQTQIGRLNMQLELATGNFKGLVPKTGQMADIRSDRDSNDKYIGQSGSGETGITRPIELTVPVVFVPEIAQPIDTEAWQQLLTGGTSALLESAVNGLIEASNSGDWSQFGKAIKEGMADFLIDFGKMLVMQGAMILAADALTKLGPVGAIGAIAIGGAAIALGVLMKGKSPNLSGSSGGGAPSIGGGGSVSKQSCPIMEGFSRYAANGDNPTRSSNSLGSTNGSEVVFRIEGDALVGLLHKQQAKQKSLY